MRSLVAGAVAIQGAPAQEEVALAVACLICCCGQVAAPSAKRAWYWAKALDLLDRLCTIGIEGGRPTVSEDQIDVLSGFLANQRRVLARRNRVRGLWTCVRSLLPATA